MSLESLALDTNFTPVDWALIGVYLVFTVAVGIYVNRYIASMEDYVVAGRSLKSYVALATMIGSELGLVTVMYSAQKGFTGGLAAFHIGLVAGIVTLVVGLTGFIVVPLRRMRVMTIPEFYERRFGRGVRVFGGIVLAAAGILNMGMFLKAGAIFVAGLTGMNNPLAINVIMSVLLVIVLAYTILGGMVSVVITDYIQFVVLSVGMLVACGLALNEVGWSGIVESVQAVHGEPGFNPLHGEGFGLSYVVWMVFVAGLVSCAVWQTAVARACSVESTAVVKRLYRWASIGFLIRFMIPQFLGICALAYFWQNPELRDAFFVSEETRVGAKVVSDISVVKDSIVTMQAFPIFLSQILPVGLIGIVGAGMLAAFMSTHDSYLLCWASVLSHDVAGPILGKRLSLAGKLFLARLLILLIGVFLLVWGLWYPLGQDLWDYMAVTGAVYFTGAFALLLAGLYWKRASRTGAVLALLAGSMAVLGLKPILDSAKRFFDLPLEGPLLLPLSPLGLEGSFKVTSERIGLATAALALILMFLGSLLFPDRSTEDSEGYLKNEEARR